MASIMSTAGIFCDYVNLISDPAPHRFIRHAYMFRQISIIVYVSRVFLDS